MSKLEQLKNNFLQELQQVQTEEQWAQLQKKYLRTELKDLYGSLKSIADEGERKQFGQDLNQLKAFLETELEQAKGQLASKKTSAKFYFDPTAIKNQISVGKVHPLIKFSDEVVKVFVGMGFQLAAGPEIELEENNFEKLNIPLNHPARDMQDTFYLQNDNKLLRSHTSSVQIRTMERQQPPLKIISLGNVYRVDDIDAQHTPMFYQCEGLVVDENITFADLKGVLINFITAIFGDRVKVRFRPSYYPYTEPSAAVDMSCIVCDQKGCRTCKDSGWITILGSGMVHPNVFKAVNIDPKRYTGFAFGLGINRLAMIYYHMTELRGFYENDISLWSQL